MSEALHCAFCAQEADGLTLYSVGGVFRLMVCEPCYSLLLAKETQPHSQPMRWLHRLLGLNGREVVNDAGRARCHTGLGHTVSAVAQEKAQHQGVPVAEPAVGFARRNTPLTRRDA